MDVCLYGAGDAKPAATTATYVWKIGEEIKLSNGENGGYMLPCAGVTFEFDESRDYFYPIPINDLSLNKNLTQNPGWDDIKRQD